MAGDGHGHGHGYVPGKGGHGKIPYPTHVWSPAGGWYAQPKNWKSNTAIVAAVMFGLCCITWTASARLEERPRMPEPGRFYPSRYWSKQIIEHEKKQKELAAAQTSSESS
ncbi:hypothetical protein NA57DRAFT_81265 [Rhizodiscina lignyota]|uniref:Transmembrane protein n=1 Tax=Rhizodiscina lignyota TaxID=1504668 RepID=A0A9P4I1N3_9PEZI|nr:hypothetical protein NA57DRAFT_81265 [Rhizodiscina lignyota]